MRELNLEINHRYILHSARRATNVPSAWGYICSMSWRTVRGGSDCRDISEERIKINTPILKRHAKTTCPSSDGGCCPSTQPRSVVSTEATSSCRTLRAGISNMYLHLPIPFSRLNHPAAYRGVESGRGRVRARHRVPPRLMEVVLEKEHSSALGTINFVAFTIAYVINGLFIFRRGLQGYDI